MASNMLAKATLLGWIMLQSCSAFSLVNPSSVSSLLKEHASEISNLREAAEQFSDPPSDPIFYLRYCLADSTSDEKIQKLQSTLQWRSTEGKSICTAAQTAITAATSDPDLSWDNTPVRDSAPFASKVNKYITPSECITTSTRKGDLCYCIRAGKIDDVALMSEVSLEEMTDFFLYCKEVNALVANARSAESDSLVSIITANDLKGVKLVGGDATFRKALSAASTKANQLYPNVAGPTLLLNLPRLLGALVKIFTPLFPKEVRKRIAFANGPLNGVDNLVQVVEDGKEREKFQDYLDELVYDI